MDFLITLLVLFVFGVFVLLCLVGIFSGIKEGVSISRRSKQVPLQRKSKGPLHEEGRSSLDQVQPCVLAEPSDEQQAKENHYPIAPPDSKYPDYKIDYIDESGQYSQRRITIIDNQSPYLECYCHLRKARRTFLVSRIQKATNCKTGEIVADIQADMAASLEGTVWGTLMRMYSDLYPPMGVLLHLGKGDRRLMKGERSILIATFQVLCADERVTDELVNDELDRLTVPSRTAFRRLLIEMKTYGPEIKSLVLESSEKLFSTRKKLNPLEKEGLEAVQKSLASRS